MVLNNKEGVGAKTRESIANLLIENGYRINLHEPTVQYKSIRFLKYSRHSYLVNGNAGFVSAIIDSVEKEARSLNFDLVMTVFGKNNIREIFDLVRAQPLDGIILLATEFEKEDICHLRNIPVPIVAIDNYMDLEHINCVNMNNYEATFCAVKYLADLGHPRIGYLYNNMPSSNCLARLQAYKAALGAYNLPLDHNLIYPLHPTMSGSYEMALELLQNNTTFPSALVATNDSIALGAIKAFKEYGLRIPEDISVVGFDDIPYSAINDPPLTTMNVSCQDIGSWAMRLLCDRIQNTNAPFTKIQVGTTLITRSSTCTYTKNNHVK